MRFIKGIFFIGLVLSAGYVNAADPNLKDIKKVESELQDAQQRLENVKQRLADQNEELNSNSPSLKERLNDAVDSVKSRLGSKIADADVKDYIPNMPDLQNIGQESFADKAGRKVREALGRETLIDSAHRIFNEARSQLSEGVDDMSKIGQESVAERTARRVREIFGRETVRDKMQRKYNDALDILNEAKSIDYSQFPEKAQSLKDRLSVLGQQALDKYNELSTDNDASTWEKLKLRLGITHEPTATEKAALIAKHLKDSAIEKGQEMYDQSSNSKVGMAFNAFVSKLGAKPAAAINIAKQWIVSDPETREAARQSHTISAEAHEALDELLQKLLTEVGENAESVDSIEVSVKPKSNINEPSSYLDMLKNKIYGSVDEKAATKAFDPQLGYEGMKDVVAELIDTVKAKAGISSPLLKDETYTAKAARKVRETLGRDTYSDKLYQAQEGLSKHSVLDMIKSRLPASIQSKITESDLKNQLSSLGEETMTEKAARKIRESVGKDTFADQIHHALDDIRSNGIMDTASNMASDAASSVKDSISNARESISNVNTESITDKIEDVKDYLSGLTGETRSEKLARKVREALGRDTMVDKAHAKVEDAWSYYNNLRSAANVASSIKNAAQDAKDSVSDSVSGLASSIKDGLSGEEAPRKGKLATIRDAVFGDPKDNKIKDAKALLEDAIAKLEAAKKL